MVSILIDEAHANQINLYTFKGLEEIIIKHDIIPYRLIQKPITSEQIRDEDILFIGAPGQPFLEDEIMTIQRFVERENKILIIVYGTSSEFNSNLGLMVQKYGIDFNYDLVHDNKNNKMGQYIPIIKNISKHFITKGIKKINYSGSSINIYDNSSIPLALSSNTAIPPQKPVMVLGCNEKLIVIGGPSIFSDAEFGLSAADNKKLIENLFKYCLKKITGKISQISRDHAKQARLLRRQEEKARKEQEKLERKRKKLNLKDQLKQLSKNMNEKNQEIKKIEKEADAFWTKISELISTAKNLKELNDLKEDMNAYYGKLRDHVGEIRDEALNLYYDVQALFSDPEKFQIDSQDIINSLYVAEAEAETKLDMVRNNLIQLYNNKIAQINRNN
ncbi:MAG: Gldg family protein [Candidatus Helarchaeota archaeon]